MVDVSLIYSLQSMGFKKRQQTSLDTGGGGTTLLASPPSLDHSTAMDIPDLNIPGIRFPVLAVARPHLSSGEGGRCGKAWSVANHHDSSWYSRYHIPQCFSKTNACFFFSKFCRNYLANHPQKIEDSIRKRSRNRRFHHEQLAFLRSTDVYSGRMTR